MLSRQEEMEDRKEYLENEKRLRAQGTTFARFAQSEAGEARGRFAAHEQSQVVGATPIPKYEGAPNWAYDPVPQENPIGVDINALEPVGESFEIARSHELKAISPPLSPSLPSVAKATPPARPQVPPLARRAGGLSSSSTYRRA
jgi:hypothetical protein